MLAPVSGTESTKHTSKQNRTRDSEIKNKLTVTRGEVGGDNEGESVKGFSGSAIKDTWTKPSGGGIRGGRSGGWGGGGGVMGGKCRQLYLNKNKTKK